jgi:hypothetical protein
MEEMKSFPNTWFIEVRDLPRANQPLEAIGWIERYQRTRVNHPGSSLFGVGAGQVKHETPKKL